MFFLFYPVSGGGAECVPLPHPRPRGGAPDAAGGRPAEPLHAATDRLQQQGFQQQQQWPAECAGQDGVQDILHTLSLSY